MKWLDYVKIVGLLVLCLMPMVVLVLLAMRFEQYRARRALATFRAGIQGTTSQEVRGPGAWRLTAIEGTRGGCAVALGPKVLGTGTAVDVGAGAPVRLKTMGYQLIVRGAPRTGSGAVTVRGGLLLVTGDVPAPPTQPASLLRALTACDTTLSIVDGEARADLAFPTKPVDATRALALVDAVAAYLLQPA